MPIKADELVWQVFPKQETIVEGICARLEQDPLVAQLLLNRNIRSLAAARAFLEPPEEGFDAGFPETDMTTFATLLSEAIEQKQRIFIVGDYDVDGMTSTSMFTLFLRELGAEVAYYIPHRFSEGYGLNMGMMDTVIHQQVDLLITLDCGISNLAELNYLKSKRELKVVIMDHHTMPKDLPPADLIINPKCLEESHPYYFLCTAGIVFKVLGDYVQRMGLDFDVEQFCDLAALGTVADVVPLIDENRVIVRRGLKRLSQRKNVGIRALLDAAEIDAPEITSTDIGFGIGPRLNAAGRLRHAKEGVALLTETDHQKAYKLARDLDKLNQERRQIGERMYKEAKAMVEADPSMLEDNILVLSSPIWHSGVIGITASQLVKDYKVPAMLISADGKVARGSARSVPGVNCYTLLSKCKDYFEGFGGHKEAAGFSIDPARIPEFQKALRAVARESVVEEDCRFVVDIDAVLEPSRLSMKTVRLLEPLMPYGHGNPEPVFYTNELVPVEFKTVGNGQHLKCTFSDPTGKMMVDAIGFRLSDKIDRLYKKRVELVFHLDINRWMGRETMQLRLIDIK